MVTHAGFSAQGENTQAVTLPPPPLEPIQYALNVADNILNAPAECRNTEPALQRAREIVEMLESQLQRGDLVDTLRARLEENVTNLTFFIRASYQEALEQLIDEMSRAAETLGNATRAIKRDLVHRCDTFARTVQLLEPDERRLRTALQMLESSSRLA